MAARSSSGVVDFDPRWKATFQEIRAHVEPALADIALAIEHVGSTAVEGLAAKPIIDIDVVVLDASAVPAAVRALHAVGYAHLGDQGITGREAFEAPAELPANHLYVVVDGSPPHRDHVDLRDYLRGHPEEAARYAAEKRRLAPLLETDREAYVEGKAWLIQEMLKNARRHPHHC